MSIELAVNYYNDPRLANLSTDKSQQALAFLYDNLITKDSRYRQLDFDQREQLRQAWMRKRPRVLDGYQAQNVMEAELLGSDSQTRRDMIHSIDADRAVKQMFGITGAFVKQYYGRIYDQFAETEGAFADFVRGGKPFERRDLSAINPEVEQYARYLEGEQDNKTGDMLKTIFNGYAIAGDMIISQGLYGSISAGTGLAGSALSKAKALQPLINASNSARGVTRLLGKAGIGLTEALIEGGGYIAEENFIRAVDAIANDEDFQAADPLRTFATGVALSGIGNALGEVLQGVGGSLVRTFQWEGFRPRGVVAGMPAEDVGKSFRVSDDAIQALRVAGADDEALEGLVRADARAREWMDNPNRWQDRDEVAAFVFNQFNDADVAVKAGGNLRVSRFAGQEISPITFKSWEDLSENFNIVRNASWEKLAKTTSQHFGDIKVTAIRQGQAGKVKLSKATVNDLFARQGEVDVDGIRRYLQAVGQTDINVVPREDYFKLNRGKQGKDLYVPTRLNNSDESLAFADRFLRATGTVDASEALSFVRQAAKGLDYNSDNLVKLVGKDAVEFSPNGSVKVSGEAFETIDHAMAAMQARQFTEPEIIAELGKRDINIRQQPDSTLNVRVGQEGEWRNYKDFPDMFLKDSTTRLGFDVDQGFKLAAPDLNIKRAENIATGGRDSLRQRLAGYNINKNLKHVKTFNGDKILFDKPNDEFIVEFGESGIRLRAGSKAEAEKIALKGVKAWENLEQAAELKGYRVTPTEFGYAVSGNGTERAFRNKQALKKWLGAQEEFFNLKEFTDLNDTEVAELNKIRGEQFNKQVKAIDAKVEKLRSGPPPRTSQVGEAIRRFTVPMTERIRNLGDPRASQLNTLLNQQHKAFENHYRTIVEETNRIFQKFSALDNDRMQDILAQEVSSDVWPDLLRNMGYTGDKLNEMLGALGQIRQTYDVLGQAFGVNPDMWVRSYSTRVRETNLAELNNGKAFDPRNIFDPKKEKLKDLDFYARNLREEDFIEGKFGNAQTMLNMYARAGLRERYLASGIRQTNEYLEQLKKVKGEDAEVFRLLSDQTKRASGRVYNTERLKTALHRRIANERMIQRIEEGRGRFANISEERKAALVQRYKTRDVDYITSTLINSSIMAWKLRLPLRNVSQVYTTLGPVFGNEYVWKSMSDVYENGAQYYTEALNKGIISQRNPRAMNDFLAWLQNTNRAGMNHFHNSDDFTRIIAMKTVGERFDDAWRSLQKGEIDVEKFMRYSKADMLDEGDKKRFLTMMQAGQISDAKTMMEVQGTRWTMFDYGTLNKPEGQTTTMGKYLGQFSTYPLGYAQLLQRAMRGGSVVDKLAFASRLSLNTYAVYYLYNELLGIQGMPTNPVGTLTFTGGPMVGAIAGVYNSLNNPSMGVGDKIGAIGREASTFVPFFGVAKKEMQAIQSIIEQDYHNAAVYALGGSPTD